MDGDTADVLVPYFDFPGMEARTQRQSDLHGGCFEIQRAPDRAARAIERLGEPIGRQYMERVAAFLPDAHINDDFADPASWHIRHYGKTARSLGEMLSQQEDWLAVIRRAILTP